MILGRQALGLRAQFWEILDFGKTSTRSEGKILENMVSRRQALGLRRKSRGGLPMNEIIKQLIK